MEPATVLVAVLPRGEALELADWGMIRGDDAGLGRVGLFARTTRSVRDHLLVGITARLVILLRVDVTGVVCRRFVPRAEPELLRRDEVIVERGATDGRSVPVRFVRRDGSACLVELYGAPAAWASLFR